MTVVTNSTASNIAPAMESRPAGSMDHNDFLRLMTTQLTTQDPFNPVDNTQMVAQMAQFSQVAGIAEMNQTLKAMAESMGVGTSGRLADAASWIGRAMLVQSDIATPMRDGAYAGEITLPEDASRVTLSFVDETGAVVHSQDLGEQERGALTFAWDGRNAEGETVANGPLRLVVNAQAGSKALAATTSAWTAIGGIQSPASGGQTRLVTGLGLLPPEAAIRLA